MKKHIVVSLIIIILNMLVSCKKTIIDAASSKTMSENKEKIDYDLSSMNYNMFSAFTYEILYDTEKYINKRMKIKGDFDSSIYKNERFYSVILWDSTGCCPTGMNFVPPENMKFPEDFPELDTKMTVIGILQYYEIKEIKYIMLNAEDISWDN